MRAVKDLKSARERKHEKGAVIVELALALPVLILFFIGALDFASAVFASIELNHAVTAGAEYGILDTGNTGDTAGIRTHVQQDAPDLSGVTATSTNYCWCPGSTTSVNCSTTFCDGSGGSLGNVANYGQPKWYVSVTGNYTWTSFIRWPGVPRTITMARTVVMRAR